LEDSETILLEKIMSPPRRLHNNEFLYRMDEPITSLYSIRTGHFKTSRIDANGQQQIMSFHMACDLLGLDALSTGRHHCEVVALEDSEVIEIRVSRLEELFTKVPKLLHNFHRLMSQEITRELDAMHLLGSKRANQRVAAFLLDLSSRYKERGLPALHFKLRMSRNEIGNHLGLNDETVSRVLTEFKKKDWLRIVGRDIELIDMLSLKTLAESTGDTQELLAR
jgi:CRP/FNR family transcriptional regulator